MGSLQASSKHTFDNPYVMMDHLIMPKLAVQM